PDPRDADELHDALVASGFLTEEEAQTIPAQLFDELTAARRAAIGTIRHQSAIPNPQSIRNPQSAIRNIRVAAERLPELSATHPAVVVEPALHPPPSRAAGMWTRDEAIVELLRGRLGLVGPTTAQALADSLATLQADADAALLALEAEGVAMRGSFTPGNAASA